MQPVQGNNIFNMPRPAVATSDTISIGGGITGVGDINDSVFRARKVAGQWSSNAGADTHEIYINFSYPTELQAGE